MNCRYCDRPLQRLLDLPNFPLTEKYEPWSEEFEEGRGIHDQAFLYCEHCEHGSLESVVPDLYGSGYLTTTGKSKGASNAVRNFASFINAFVMSGFDLVIDIGANDATLLERFYGVDKVAVDPHARGDAFCIRETIENADLSGYAEKSKLIISSHTIEHLERPEVLIGKASSIMLSTDYLALQFPSLELLVEDARIDQIHHQHLHYFSLRSISKMLYMHGLKIVAHRFDESHWGALMVLAMKGSGKVEEKSLDVIDVENSIRTFMNNEVHVPKGSLALGAALMLPVLSYWFPEMDAIDCIVDDDVSKNGLRYINFNKKIVCGHNLIEGRNVVITAIGSKTATRALTKKAIDEGAKRIILPLHTI